MRLRAQRKGPAEAGPSLRPKRLPSASEGRTTESSSLSLPAGAVSLLNLENFQLRREGGLAAAPPHSGAIFPGWPTGWREGEMQDNPSSTEDRNLKAADEFFDLARGAPNPFMRAYYERVALRYLSSEGELKATVP
jgi:hypothetical protein